MNWRRYAAMALAGAASLVASSAISADRYTLGTNPQGTIYYTIGGGIAAALQEKLGKQVTVQPYTGSSVYLPLISAGEVTMGEVLTVLPFQNTLATFKLKGADVVASIESGLSQIEDGAGRFPQVSGLRYSYDMSVAPGDGRVQSVEVREGGDWAPIDPDKTYTVATNNFMRGGGDGYALFASNAEDAYDYGPGLEQVVADYLAANSPYTPYTDGRIAEAKAMMEEEKSEEMTEDASMKEENMETATDEAKAEEPAADASMEKTEMAAAEADKPAMADGNMHEVVAGDNLWNLAKQFYGDGSKWKMIAEANPDINPKNLKVGSKLNVPAAN